MSNGAIRDHRAGRDVWAGAHGPPPYPGSGGYGIHEVGTPYPETERPIPTNYEGFQRLLVEAFQEFCEQCVIRSQPTPFVEPDHRTRSRTTENLAVIFGDAAVTGAATALADAEGVFSAGPNPPATPADIVTVPIEAGFVGVLFGFAAAVHNGDPAAVTWNLRVDGGEEIFVNRVVRNASPRRPDLQTAFTVLQPNNVLRLQAATASTVSPYLVEGFVMTRLWPVSRGGDSLEALTYRGRMR